MSENLYSAPESDLTMESDESVSIDLASRWRRLGASLLDAIIGMLILFPILFLFGWFQYFTTGDQMSILMNLAFGLLWIVIFIAINYRLLVNNGQTIGKKILNIKIVDMDGKKAEMKDHIVKRYIAYFIPNQIPVIGSVIGLVNVLFIFRSDKRCIHDLIGKTQVVNA